MALNNRSALDSRWTRHQTPVAEDFMLATITVQRKKPNDGGVTYDPTTGEYSNAGVVNIIEHVKARIQPFGIIGDMVVAQDTTSRRLMRIQIARVDTDINQDDMIVVEECPDNPELCDFQIEVRGTISSSNAWHTDIVAEADTKRRV